MKLLIMQTAFIGDVILATSLVEILAKEFPKAEIHFLLRKGNETLLSNHPAIKKIICWNKSKYKYLNLILLAFQARKQKYDYVINIQRYASSGIFSAICGAKVKIGFKQNLLSFFFTHKIIHKIPYPYKDSYLHEVQRNALLLRPILKSKKLPEAIEIPPRLYPTPEDFNQIKSYQNNNYIVLAPSSVWFTKQWPKEKWIALKERLYSSFTLYFIGGPDDKDYIQSIIGETKNCFNLCGKVTLLQSAALMKNAVRVIVNDSAPLHLASSVNAPTTAIFCSTVPEFGYTSLSDNHRVMTRTARLKCMPCGLHGRKACPLGHFKCAFDIDVDEVLKTIYTTPT